VPSRNLFAAGEVSAGNVLGKGYLAGIGVTIGTAFGRIAGAQAARAALQPSSSPTPTTQNGAYRVAA
jgi:tricarballylate dehydrogenase